MLERTGKAVVVEELTETKKKLSLFVVRNINCPRA
jgi:hypothetical protein